MTTNVPVHYFIWYRIDADAPDARAAVNAVMQDVALACAVTARLFVRREDPHTWMETYEPVSDPAAFEAELATALARHGLDRAIEGPRHVERFLVAP